jgi:hypothetical protein
VPLIELLLALVGGAPAKPATVGTASRLGLLRAVESYGRRSAYFA